MKPLNAICTVCLLTMVGCATPNSSYPISDIAKPTTANPEAPIWVKLTTDLSAMTYTIVISNTSGHPVSYWDTLSDKSHYTLHNTGPAWLRVWDSKGQLLTGNQYHDSGWWDSSVYSNTIWPLPISMSSLPSGTRLKFTYGLKNLCFGCCADAKAATETGDQWLAGKQIQLRAAIYYDDPSLKLDKTIETAKMNVPSDAK